MDRAFYDLRPDAPTSAYEAEALQHEGQIDRERQYVERAARKGDVTKMHRALRSLHAREERPER